MTTKTYTNLREFLESIDATHLYRSSRKAYIRDYHPTTYADIFTYTAAITDAKFNERLYCYANSITCRPTCKKCTKDVTFSTIAKVAYHRYCGRKCSMKDMPVFLGVDNASQLDSVKAKKKATARKKYGVDNVAQADEVKVKISEGISAAWEVKFEELIDHVGDDVSGMTKREYNKLVWRITEWMYNKHIDVLDPLRQRGKDFNLDHKVSRCYGFYNKISPAILGDVTNLELLPYAVNSKKGHTSSMTADELYAAYNLYYTKNEKVPETTFTERSPPVVSSRYSTQAIGICVYCSNIASYILGRGKKERWCCSESRNKCTIARHLAAKKLKVKKKRVISQAQKDSISAANTGKKAPAHVVAAMVAGRKKHSFDNNSGKHWYNNGIDQVLKEVCPDGFVPGKLR